MTRTNAERHDKPVRRLCELAAMVLAVFLVGSASIPAAQAQTGLSRLFTTPPLRAELDRRRLRQLQGAPVERQPSAVQLTLQDIESEQPIPDTIYALGGSMRRSDGTYTIWINSRSYAESDLPSNMELLQPYNQGQMRITDPESGANYIIKPGQVLNLTQGAILESYQYQAQTTAAVAAAANAEPGEEDAVPVDADAPAETGPTAPGNAQELIDQAEDIRDQRP